jgi:hypothetical protein
MSKLLKFKRYKLRRDRGSQTQMPLKTTGQGSSIIAQKIGFLGYV